MWTDGFLQSILFDGDKAYIRFQDQMKAADYSMPVVGIALVNDLYEYEKDQSYHYYEAVEEAQSGNVVKDFSLVFVELPKVGLRPQEADNKQNRWLTYFNQVGDSMAVIPAILAGDEEIMTAINLCKVESCTEKEIFEYNRFKSATDVRKGINSEAEARGFRRGIEKGIELGLEKGFARGFQKGGLAAVRRLALKALQTGLAPDEVMMITELNQMTIDNLVNLVGEFGASADKHLGD